jgi:hypothetical protein|tara:strand:+ start:386 stop:844 length:459 start_codon:yes stop_codon:yes gene_type:complete
MKKIISILIVLISLNTYAQNEEQEIQELQFNYLSFLKSEGYIGSITDDGDIKFKFEGNPYYIWPSKANYFSLSYFLKNEEEGCSNKAKAVVKASNNVLKATSVSILGENCNIIEIKTQTLLVNPDDYKQLFKRCIRLIRSQVEIIQEEYENH